jgi:hypothetical protein
MNMSFVGTATGDTYYLLVSGHRNEKFLNLSSLMTSLDPDEIKRVKFQPVKCPKYKLAVMVKPGGKVCPVCGSALPKPVKR